MSEGHAMNVHARKRTVFSSKFTEENVVFQRGDSSTRASSLENLLFFVFCFNYRRNFVEEVSFYR